MLSALVIDEPISSSLSFFYFLVSLFVASSFPFPQSVFLFYSLFLVLLIRSVIGSPARSSRRTAKLSRQQETIRQRESTMIQAAKIRLRMEISSKMKSKRASVMAMESGAVTTMLQQFPPYQRARSIGVFMSMPMGEVQTYPFVMAALQEGKEIYLPYLYKPSPEDREHQRRVMKPHMPEGWEPPKKVMDLVRVANTHDLKTLIKATYDIPTPTPESIPYRLRVLGEVGEPRIVPNEDIQLDLILVPGIGFDIDVSNGRIRRCGHGRGFYDYFFKRYEVLKAHTEPPHLCGIALTEQVMPGFDGVEGAWVPTEPHDKTLDTLIVGDGRILGRFKPHMS